MKPNALILAVLIAAGPLLAAPAGNPAPTESRAEVIFFEPQKFTDVRDSYMAEGDRAGYLDQLRNHIVRQAHRFIPPGHTLQVTFTDIDMAGDFEPWRGPQWQDVRIIKDIYPPRMELSFRVTDAEGNVVAQGDRVLRDLAFMMKIPMASQNDPLRHEKALIDDWLRSEFQRPRR
jgi:hypothetical protein